MWLVPRVLKSSSRASHSSSLVSLPYARVDNNSLWVQLGATSGFSAGSSKPIPTSSATFLRKATCATQKFHRRPNLVKMPGLRHLFPFPGSPTIFPERPLARSENVFSIRLRLCHPGAPCHDTFPARRVHWTHSLV